MKDKMKNKINVKIKDEIKDEIKSKKNVKTNVIISKVKSVLNTTKNIINEVIILSIFLKNRMIGLFLKKRNKDINILFIIGKIGNGGAERACVNLAEELNKKYNVKIVVFNECENEYKCSVKVIKLNNKNGSMLNRIKEIQKIKKDENITHTISFLINPNFANVVTKTYDKAIISVRNYMSDSNSKNKKEIKLHKFSCKFADKIVSVSKNVEKDQLKNWHIKRKKSLTIPNFIDDKKIIESIENGKIDECDEDIFKDSKVVINIGRLVEQKGQANLIMAFKYVVKKVPNAKLIILGDGYLKPNLQNLIKQLNLENNVYILGFKNNPYVYMKNSHLFVSNSHYEGMSNVILEAMKCSLPIIATDSNGGNREILVDKENTYGILTPTAISREEEKTMANQIIRLLNHENVRQNYVVKSQERIKKYRKEIVVKKWETIIKKEEKKKSKKTLKNK